MKAYILTDLTRFSKLDKVCIALIDPESGQCFRPLPYLTSKACSDLDIQPGAKVLGQLTLRDDRQAPHIEDSHYGDLKFAGPSTAQEFRDILEKTLSPSVSEGFGVPFQANQKHIPDDTPAQSSILTIKVNPNEITIHEDQYNPGKIRFSFRDTSGHQFCYLSITDRGFYDFAQQHQNDSKLEKVQELLQSQEEIFLRIGLSRSFKAKDGREGCWVQVNGIYSFPDYPREIRQFVMEGNKPVLYTVGHSVHPIDHFIAILKMNKIEAIADVRSSPYSRFTPQFNREPLKDSLKSEGIQYVFLGDELGARRDEPQCYENGKVIYHKVAGLPLFLKGVERLQEGVSKMRVAIMCAEKDPLTCHRTVLVAHFAREKFSDTLHILEDGSIETRDNADKRLLRELKLDKEDFFNPYVERLKTAYAQRGEKIAYAENEQQATHG